MPFCSCAKQGGGQIALARALRRIRVGLRSRGKRARATRRGGNRAEREYRRVSRGRACMKSHPSSRLITLRSFIIVDARASRSRCVDQERVGTLARRAAVADEI